MARCGPVVPVIDTNDPTVAVRGGCVVHAHYAPCTRDGEPAAPEALNADSRPTAQEVLAEHRYKTRGQRPLVLHMGAWSDLGPDGQQHVVDGRVAVAGGCWCGPVVFPAETDR